MVDGDTNPLYEEALALVRSGAAAGDTTTAAEHLVGLAGPDRAALEAARDAFARQLRARSDDYEATMALRLLNRALAAYGWHDPYDWHGRFGHRFLIKP